MDMVYQIAVFVASVFAIYLAKNIIISGYNIFSKIAG